MVAKDGTITVSLTVGKKDQDIADWFNMLRREGQSKSMWASALLMAYDQGIVLEAGCVTTPGENADKAQSARQNQPQSGGNRHHATDMLLFGTGKINPKPYRYDSGWGNRGANGEYIIGSTITLRITNRKVIKTYWKLVGEGFHISTLMKYTLRAGLRHGPEELPPNPADARKLLIFPPFKTLTPVGQGRREGQTHGSHAQQPTIPLESVQAVPSTGQTPQKGKTRNPLLDYI